MGSQQRWSVRSLQQGDRDAWERLFRGYAEFYKRSLTDEQLATVWSWIFDDQRMIALVVVPVDGGEAVGLAHLREWIRPLRTTNNGYLDDLFVDPAKRGTGAVDALFAAIDAMAFLRAWDVVRWTTADDNHRARSVYDKVATRTMWITYDMSAGATNPS